MSEVPRPSSWGAFPMVPWAGRIKYGKFTFDGVDYEMPINHPPHAMHGTAYTSEWEAIGPDTMRLELGDPWPFGGHTIHHAVCRRRDGSLSVGGARRRSSDAGDGGLASLVSQAGRAHVHRRADVREGRRGHPDRPPRRSSARPVGRHVHRPRGAASVAVARRRHAHGDVDLRSLGDLHAARTRARASSPRPARPTPSTSPRRSSNPAPPWSRR